MGREDPRRRVDPAAMRRVLAPIIAQRRAEAAALQEAIDKAVAGDPFGYVWWHHWVPVSKRKKDPPPARASGQRRD